MPVTQIDIKSLRKIIREEMREIVRGMVEEEFRLCMMELRLSLVPKASDDEQREIEEMFGEPGPDDVAVTYTLKVK